MMNTGDVVRVLKACGEGKAACAECPWENLHGEECHFAKSRAAAELIESLITELDKLKNRIAYEGFPDLETMISKYKTVILAANETSIDTCS